MYGYGQLLIASQEFILHVRHAENPDIYVGRRYGEFATLHKRLRAEFPGKILPPLPRKNKSSMVGPFLNSGDDDASSVSSMSTQDTGSVDGLPASRLTALVDESHRRSRSRGSLARLRKSPASSSEQALVLLYREEQRVSLRAFLRTILQNKHIAESKAIEDFFAAQPINLNEEELQDIRRRKEADAARIAEQKRFYEVARQRAAELDIYMEKFRQDIVESSK